jgi:hypothetical protein
MLGITYKLTGVVVVPKPMMVRSAPPRMPLTIGSPLAAAIPISPAIKALTTTGPVVMSFISTSKPYF